MRSFRIEIFATVVILGATVCAILFSPLSFKRKAAPSKDGKADAAAESSKRKPDLKQNAGKGGKSGKASPAAKAPLKVSESLRSQIKDEIGAIERPAGSGRFTGKVVDKKGNAVPGANVNAQRQNVSFRYSRKNQWWRSQDLGQKIDAYLQNFKDMERNNYGAVSDAQGRFVIKGLPDGRYYLSAWAEGFANDYSNYRLYEPDAEVTIVVKPVLELKVLVLAPDGDPAQSARLSLGRQATGGMGGATWQADWTAEDPVVEVQDEGIYVLSARDEQRGCASDSVNVSVKAGAMPDEVVLRLEEFPGVKGKVIFEGASAEEGPSTMNLEVYVIQVPQDGERTWEYLRQGMTVNVGSYNNYEYCFDRLVPGNYLLGCMADNRLTMEEVSVSDKMVKKDLRIPPPDRKKSLIVAILDPAGNIISDCQISAGYRFGGGFYGGQTAARLLPDGTYRIAIPDPDPNLKAPPDKIEYEVSANSNSFGSKKAACPNPPPERLTIQFEQEALVEVCFTNYGRSGYEERLGFGLFPEAEKNRYCSGNYNNAPRVSSKGILKLGPVQPGKYAFVLFIKTERWQYTQIQELSMDISADENAFDIALPELYTLSVAAPADKAGQYASLRKAGNPQNQINLSIQLGKDGVGLFRNLAAGSYVVWFNGKETEVSVPEDKAVELE